MLATARTPHFGENIDTDGDILGRVLDQKLVPNWIYNNYSRRF
jgi:hypothetical protein